MSGGGEAMRLLLADARGEAIALRLHRAAPERLSAPLAVESDLGAALGAARAGCVVVGPLEPLIEALAPLLVEGRAPALLVAVAVDGQAVVPLRGGEQAEQLARALAAPLAVLPALTSGGALAPLPGRLAVVGLGPGSPELLAPQAREELARAQDILGYATYVEMAGPFRADQVVHPTDNRQELERARAALDLAASGRHVVMVSSGDPGIFAMATAILEALEEGRPAWEAVDLVVVPGISAAQATAARAGAPLGHDCCILSLSDNLKPWAVILERLELAARADLVLALYNPISRARPWQLGEALERLRTLRAPHTPVVLGRDIARPGERLTLTTLGALRPEEVDMRTLVIVGSSQTRCIDRPGASPWVYTPRWYPEPSA